MHKIFAPFTSQSEYEYSRLQTSRTIRLFDLFAGTAGDKLKGRLREVSIDDDISYEAVSYAWADQKPSQPLRLGSGGVVLKISKTLTSALKQFRYPKRSRSLWIDAVCINQHDDDEKSTQVQMMVDIFRKAEQVLGWLGDEGSDSKLVFDFMSSIDQKEVDWATQVYPAIHLKSRSSLCAVIVKTFSSNSAAPSSLGRFLSRPWFRRAWVQQEAAVAKQITLRCGKLDGLWPAFFAFVFAISQLRQEGNVWYREAGIQGISSAVTLILALEEFRQRAAGFVIPTDLLRRLKKYRYCLATDPRDRLYAAQSMVSNWTWLPKVDYSIDCAEVYTRFAAACTEQGAMEILWHAGTAYHTMQGLPSWVPDWTCIRRGTAGPQRRSASGFVPSCSRIVKSGADTLLILDGLTIDIIKDVSGVLSDDLYGTERLRRKMFLEARCEELVASLETQTEHKKDINLVTTLWRTLVADELLGSIRKPPTDWKEYRECRERRLRLAYDQDSNDGPLTDLDLKLLQYHSSMDQSHIFVENQLCVTQQGYVGLVPNTVQPGDRVCIGLGCPMPLILRMGDTGRPAILQGPAYIDGFMRGEALDLYQQARLKPQTSDDLTARSTFPPLHPNWKRCQIKERPLCYLFNGPRGIEYISPRHPKLLTEEKPRLWGKVKQPILPLLDSAKTSTEQPENSDQSPPTMERWATDLGDYYIDRTSNSGSFGIPLDEIHTKKWSLPKGWKMQEKNCKCTYFKNEAEKMISWTDPRLYTLGPLPPGWELIFNIERGIARYYNIVNDSLTQEDPRLKHDPARKLGPLPEDWVAEKDLQTGKLTFTYVPTGKTTTEDPCLPRDGNRPEFQGFVIK